MQGLANEFSGRARFVQVHIDRAGQVLAAFESSGLPEYIVFRDGHEVDRLRFSFLSWFFEARLRRMMENSLD